MVDYFDQPIAVDPTGNDGTGTLVPNAEFEVFAGTDLSFTTPLAVYEAVSGAEINPLVSSSVGQLPQFRVEGDPEFVILKSGQFEVRLRSVFGAAKQAVADAGLSPEVIAEVFQAKDDVEELAADVTTAVGTATDAATAAGDFATAASAAASEAQTSKEAVQAVVATNDGIMAPILADPETASGAALKATIAEVAPARILGSTDVVAPLPFVNVRDFGAKGDRVTDDTAAIQAALNAAPGGTVVFPPGIYSISAPLAPMPRTTLRGEGADALYPNFTTDWQTPEPSWGFRASTIQYVSGAHGAIFGSGTFSSGGGCKYEGIVIRCGGVRTAADVVFGVSVSHIRFERNIVQNMSAVRSDNGAAWGAWLMQGNQFTGNTTVLQGSLLDFRMINNTFTSTTGNAISMTNGAGLNIIAGNRFEWGEAAGIKMISGSRFNVIANNIFDSHATFGLELADLNDPNTFTANLFWRNGRSMTGDYLDAHVGLKATSGQTFEGNIFRAGGPDGGGSWSGPRYSLSFESLSAHKNTFRGNSFRQGSKSSSVVIDRYSTSIACMDVDSVDIPAGEAPGTATDDLMTALTRLSKVVASPSVAWIHEDRTIVGYGNAARLIISGARGVARALTNSSGALGVGAGLADIVYGGLAYTMIGSDVYASAQPSAARSHGTWPVGKRIHNSAPTAGGSLGWILITAGSPDTWKTFGSIAS
ncbi:glycosyl hydrolase family 28-related protein [Microbacterium sp. KSW-18]|uniref:Glycosyl hydrolase family 28-related protein n=1 Tax=Microbacterium aquilitoris TaxID=3067307 RepID=A0ABU3GL03_9MICO|nr:glycosyl hydrolase family 28-related protein [Microbacterium sp. KSW-18]MDT3331392.1 glycosyl hydrolase family 28-related protein [Microbacterium sp. KSW-18]